MKIKFSHFKKKWKLLLLLGYIPMVGFTSAYLLFGVEESKNLIMTYSLERFLIAIVVILALAVLQLSTSLMPLEFKQNSLFFFFACTLLFFLFFVYQLTNLDKPGFGLVTKSSDFSDGLTFIKQSDCLSCHEIKSKKVGPSFQDISIKYKNEDVIKKLKEKIKSGGSGVWGKVPMNPHPDISSEKLDAIVGWILNNRYTEH